MKSLPILLRIARNDLNLLRRALGEKIAQGAALEQCLITHEQTVRDEQKAALLDYEANRAYGGFATAAIARKRALESEVVIVEQESAELRTLIIEAHVEMRKFERLLELHKERERVEAAKREDAELDEVATLRGNRLSLR